MSDFNQFSMYGLSFHGAGMSQKDKVDTMVDEIVDMDRYIALMHIIALLKKSEAKEAEKIVEIASKVEEEYKFKTIACRNARLVEHATGVMRAGKMLAGNNLKNYDNMDLLLEAINFGCREENVYLKILKMYKESGRLKNAMKFYNECYAPLFNQEFCANTKILEEVLMIKISQKKLSVR